MVSCVSLKTAQKRFFILAYFWLIPMQPWLGESRQDVLAHGTTASGVETLRVRYVERKARVRGAQGGRRISSFHSGDNP